MAIKIPSSHIYERNYSPAKENRINKLNISYILPIPKTETGVTVAEGAYEGSFTDPETADKITHSETSNNLSANITIIPKFTEGIKVADDIPVVGDYGAITSLYQNASKANVRCIVTYEKIVYKWGKAGDTITWIEESRETFENQAPPLDALKVNVSKESFSVSYDAEEEVLSKQKNIAIYYINPYAKDYYSWRDEYTPKNHPSLFVGGTRQIVVTNSKGEYIADYMERVEYVPLSATWQVFGDVSVIEYQNKERLVTDDEVSGGEYRIEGSEILQSIGRRFDSVVREYSNGKKTATLTVAVATYYDHDTNKPKISIGNDDLPMGFSIYDRVIPYVFSAKGDKPLSTNKDGTPTEFVVLQVEPFYDGSTLQKIYLQEA